MTKTFVFSSHRYAKYAWWKFLFPWLGLSWFFCLLMLINGTLSVIPALVVHMIFLGLMLLIFFNRVNAHKATRVILSQDRIDYIQTVTSVNRTYGTNGSARIYSVVRPTTVRLDGSAVSFYGNTVLTEETNIVGYVSTKDRPVASFTIYPYYENWDSFLLQLNEWR